MGKQKALVGVDSVYYALLTADSISAATWQAAVSLPGITEVGVNPNGFVQTLFADNGPALSANGIGEIEVSLKLADLTPVERAVLLGHTRTGGGTKNRGSDISPDVAIGFRTLLSDGSYGYVWLHKGKFAETQETFTTKSEKVDFQLPTLTGKFNVLAFNGEYKRTTRADDPDFVQATADNWFTNGPLGTTDTTAPTVTTVPVDGASTVSVSANIVWTFNEAIQASNATLANFMVVKASDGSVVAGALSLSSGNTVVTFDPTSNLDSSTAYIAIVTTNVHNLAGISLAANNITNFQTQ